uniref:Mab-21 domain-containing protein n=1 Tax=Macrostomum lignano TaxID=282301 RepID=A0A1I8FAB8_9PLAT
QCWHPANGALMLLANTPNLALRTCRRCCMTYSKALIIAEAAAQAVHPDLFETEPKLQAVNLASLQRLHLLLSDLSQGRVGSRSRHSFQFFLKRAGASGEAATLSVTASSGRLDDSPQSASRPQEPTAVCIPVALSVAQKRRGRPASSDLSSWLVSVAPEARSKSARSNQISDACGRLEAVLANRTGAASIRLCLSTRPGLGDRLRGRRVVFAPGKNRCRRDELPTGFLNPADVPEAWLAALLPDDASIKPQLDRICRLERAVSILLHGARVVRHSSVHGALTLAEYEACLLRLVSGLAALVPPPVFRTGDFLSVAVEDSSGHVTRLPTKPDWPVVVPARNPAFQLLEALIRLDAGDSEMGTSQEASRAANVECPSASWPISACSKHSLDSVSVDSSLSAPRLGRLSGAAADDASEFSFEGFEKSELLASDRQNRCNDALQYQHLGCVSRLITNCRFFARPIAFSDTNNIPAARSDHGSLEQQPAVLLVHEGVEHRIEAGVGVAQKSRRLSSTCHGRLGAAGMTSETQVDCAERLAESVRLLSPWRCWLECLGAAEVAWAVQRPLAGVVTQWTVGCCDTSSAIRLFLSAWRSVKSGTHHSGHRKNSSRAIGRYSGHRPAEPELPRGHNRGGEHATLSAIACIPHLLGRDSPGGDHPDGKHEEIPQHGEGPEARNRAAAGFVLCIQRLCRKPNTQLVAKNRSNATSDDPVTVTLVLTINRTESTGRRSTIGRAARLAA